MGMRLWVHGISHLHVWHVHAVALKQLYRMTWTDDIILHFALVFIVKRSCTFCLIYTGSVDVPQKV